MSKRDESVKVVVRVRPLSGEEERNGNQIAAKAFPEQGLISVRNPKESENAPPKDFFFDSVFGPNVEQKHIYDTCASGVIESVIDGYNGTIFAYGQTHTMEGSSTKRGIIPNAFQHIFDHVNSSQGQQYLVRASYLEIYNEDIRDLLAKDPNKALELRETIESGVFVKDLTSFVVKNVSEINYYLQAGKKNRKTGKTLMNDESSRSHAIFTVVIECGDAKGEHIRVGKLNLVDLAGSERQTKTGATGELLKEGIMINQSLRALGNVITALVDSKSSHVPYRDSKLTRLLQNSLGGNAKTVMCANCGPADYNYDETLSTLRYANRAKNIKNKPKINEDPKDAMLREFQEQIKALKEQLEATQRGVMLDENGKEVPMHNAKQEIVEKIVEREVIREVKVGLSKEELKEMQRKAKEEKEFLMKQAQEDMQNLISQNSRTAQERAELQQALDREAEDKRAIEEQKKQLQEKLRLTEEKLIKGGQIISKANKQEALLRKAEKELRERQAQEAALARELAEKEEANLQLEEHFSSLQEEVEVKTKKLKKLWNKFQAATREAKDLQEEFQTERTDMLDTIRQLTRTLKLTELIVANFIPEDIAGQIKKRATWNEESDAWNLPRLELSGNNARAAQTHRDAKQRRLDWDFYNKSRKHYKAETICVMTLDKPERTTQEYAGPGMKSRVEAILGMDLNGEDGDDVAFSNDNVISNPYLTYGNEGEGGRGVPDDRTTAKGGAGGEKSKSKSSKSKKDSSEQRGSGGGSGSGGGKGGGSVSAGYDDNMGGGGGGGYYQSSGGGSGSASRPKSAARKRDEPGAVTYNKYIDEDQFPIARGYVKK